LFLIVVWRSPQKAAKARVAVSPKNRIPPEIGGWKYTYGWYSLEVYVLDTKKYK
jgi:hypothetical protein